MKPCVARFATDDEPGASADLADVVGRILEPFWKD